MVTILKKDIENKKKTPKQTKKVVKSFNALGYRLNFGLKKIDQPTKEEKEVLRRLKRVAEPLRSTKRSRPQPLTDSEINELDQLVRANQLISEGKKEGALTLNKAAQAKMDKAAEALVKRPTFETQKFSFNPFKTKPKATAESGLKKVERKPSTPVKVESYTFSKTVGKSVYTKMRAMDTSNAYINKWQFNRFMTSAIVAIFSLVTVAVMNLKPIYFGGGIVVALLLYLIKGRSVSGYYTRYKFNRNLEFAKFARLIVPLLKQMKDGVSIYSVFAQILPRLQSPIDRKLLQRLMIQITDRPNDIEPYIEFSKSMSGTDFSLTFMTLLYDVSQGATDDNIIENLGKEVSSQLMDVITDIIEFKKSKFTNFPTKIVAPNMILIIGFMVCMMIYQFSQMKF